MIPFDSMVGEWRQDPGDNEQDQIDGEPDHSFVTKVIDHDEKTGEKFTIWDYVKQFEDPMPFYFWLRSQNDPETLQHVHAEIPFET